MAEVNEKKVAEATEAVAEKKPAAKKPAAPKTESTAPAAAAKKAPAKKVEEVAVEAESTAPAAAPAKKEVAKKAPAKKAAAKAKAPLYINGRYVAEKQMPAKPAKGTNPYELGKKQIKITLVKSTNGCLQNQIKTVEALGLKKINHSVVITDNAAIRGMIFKVKHLVEVVDVK